MLICRPKDCLFNVVNRGRNLPTTNAFYWFAACRMITNKQLKKFNLCQLLWWQLFTTNLSNYFLAPNNALHTGGDVGAIRRRLPFWFGERSEPNQKGNRRDVLLLVRLVLLLRFTQLILDQYPVAHRQG